MSSKGKPCQRGSTAKDFSISPDREVRPATKSSNGKRMSLLTESRLKAFRRCAREHFYAYEQGYRPVSDSGETRFGTLVHAGLEAWWAIPLLDVRPIDRLQASIEAMRAAASDETDPFELVRAEEMLRGYHFRWGNEKYETIAVEQEFTAPLKNPATEAASRSWLRGGKLDAIARSEDGRVLVIEHKTSGEDISPGSTYWDRLRMDGQCSGYLRGADALGIPAEAVIWDVLGKPRLRPLKATPVEFRRFTKSGELDKRQRLTDETPEEYRMRVREDIIENVGKYYQRLEIARLAEDMEEHDFDLWQQAQIINENRAANRWPRNQDACQRFGSLCAYFEVCARRASIDDPTKFQKLEHPHPELPAQAKEKNNG